MVRLEQRPAPGPEGAAAGGSPVARGSGGSPSAYLAPDIPELVELVDTAEHELLASADEDPDA